MSLPRPIASIIQNNLGKSTYVLREIFLSGSKWGLKPVINQASDKRKKALRSRVNTKTLEQKAKSTKSKATLSSRATKREVAKVGHT